MDITNLIIQLQAKVNDLTYNQLAVTKSIELLKTGQVNYIDSISSLPAASASNGYMYYVRGLGIYYSNGTTWTTIDTIDYIIEKTARSWGVNAFGRLGNGSFVADCSIPILVVGGFTDWCQVSAGYHSLGVRQNGTAWAWGFNGQGQLGDNSITSRASPVSVVGGFTDWCQVAASSAGLHSLGVRTNGTAWGWGYNINGRLGDNTTVSKRSPISVIGGFTDWCQVSGGQAHSLGVRTNGTAWGWGYNGQGRLGDNSATARSSPVSVVGGFTDWCQVSGGCCHSLGVRQNGTAWGWGCNVQGQIGDNTVVSKISPVSVVGGFTDWCQISAGACHSLAIRSSGTVWAWGANDRGQLGQNTVTSRSSPVSVVGGYTDWCQISAGEQHSLGVRTNGQAWAWGSNCCGSLGDGGTTNQSSPVSVQLYNDWYSVSGGKWYTLAIRNFVDS
jgi:alpha-tubulin suppressor-like RCC1 family protein